MPSICVVRTEALRNEGDRGVRLWGYGCRGRQRNEPRQSVGAHLPEGRIGELLVEIVLLEEGEVALKIATDRSEVTRERGDAEGTANSCLSIVGRVRESNSRCEVAIIVVDVGGAIAGGGNVKQASREVEVRLSIEFINCLRDDVPTQGHIQGKRLHQVILVLHIDACKVCTGRRISIDKPAIERGRNAEQEAGEGISAGTAGAVRLSGAAARIVGVEREAAVLAGIGIRQRSLKAPIVFADRDRVLAENLNEVVCNLIDICDAVRVRPVLRSGGSDIADVEDG